MVSAAGLGALFQRVGAPRLRVEVGRSVPASASLQPAPCADGGGRHNERPLRVRFLLLQSVICNNGDTHSRTDVRDTMVTDLVDLSAPVPTSPYRPERTGRGEGEPT